MTTRTNEPDLSDFMTTGEVADKYGVTQIEVQKAIRAGNLSAQKVGYFYLLYGPRLPKTFPGTSKTS